MEMTPKVYPQPVGMSENYASSRYDYVEIGNFFKKNVFDHDWISNKGYTLDQGNI